jgi:hypothetical protein
MSQAVVVLLEWARERRAAAERARRLASTTTTADVVASLERYARELEHGAHELEGRACALAVTISKARDLSEETRQQVAEVKARLEALSGKMRR